MPSPSHLDRYALYELCAQNPARDAKLLRAIHADGSTKPRKDLTLGEDFCATAALSRAWCDLSPRHRAVGIDHDRAVLARAPRHDRVTLVRSDVLNARAKADLIAVQNFSICELHDRATLVKYLRRARSRLNRGGSFICDIYGGSDAFFTGTITQRIKPPPTCPRGTKISYDWEQRSADPLTGRVVNAMHFTLTLPGKKPIITRDAFVYDWRLWSVPELRDAMTEAGFKRTLVYPRTADALDALGFMHVLPIDDPAEAGDSFNVYVVGRG